MTDWQDISTAPKDGGYIWLGAPGTLRIGYWCDGQKFEHHGSVGGGWRDAARAEAGGLSDLLFAPTHWMPLPPPPSAEYVTPPRIQMGGPVRGNE